MSEAKDRQIVEGLPGRLPAVVGGLVFFAANIVFFRLRALLHEGADAIDFETIFSWGTAILVLSLLFPLVHHAVHALVALVLGKGVRPTIALIYPRFLPARPLSKAQAQIYFLAPLALSLLALGLIVYRPWSAYAGFLGAINTGLWANDLWKLLGLKRVPADAALQIERDHIVVTR